MMQTVNERLRDESIAHAVWISRYSTGVAARMVKTLNDSDAELTARLLVALDSLDPGSFTVTRLESLLASVREVNWWRHGQNLYLDNLEATGLYQVPLSAAQPGDVLLCCFGSSVPNHAAIYCGDSELLHHIPEQLSKRERYTDKWQRRTHSLWRHRAWHASAFTGIYNDLAAAATFE